MLLRCRILFGREISSVVIVYGLHKHIMVKCEEICGIVKYGVEYCSVRQISLVVIVCGLHNHIMVNYIAIYEVVKYRTELGVESVPARNPLTNHCTLHAPF